MPNREEKPVCSLSFIQEHFIHVKIHPCNTAKDRKTDSEMPSSVITKYKNSKKHIEGNIFSCLWWFISVLETSKMELFQFLIVWKTHVLTWGCVKHLFKISAVTTVSYSMLPIFFESKYYFVCFHLLCSYRNGTGCLITCLVTCIARITYPVLLRFNNAKTGHSLVTDPLPS